MKTTFALTAAAVMSVASATSGFAEPVKMKIKVKDEQVELTIASSRFFEDSRNCGSLGKVTTVNDHLLGRITLADFNEINDLMEIDENTKFESHTMLCFK